MMDEKFTEVRGKHDAKLRLEATDQFLGRGIGPMRQREPETLKLYSDVANHNVNLLVQVVSDKRAAGWDVRRRPRPSPVQRRRNRPLSERAVGPRPHGSVHDRRIQVGPLVLHVSTNSISSLAVNIEPQRPCFWQWSVVSCLCLCTKGAASQSPGSRSAPWERIESHVCLLHRRCWIKTRVEWHAWVAADRAPLGHNNH